ncbi:hypothetical protein BU23DRAFT_580206 [Bimuria novae-zelandiae CBS 107.79]|uniref:Xylanolytic transcriptional activator regulatory domain-containing protein n=1 Tax=Bimuria novae-zelandiae CBS 107.79 TaxID=1447943 RepID=A0A6A5VAJ8_9PLEO|nr:hypothetical protein BU23DRAFT_580206 [Bimuria novae-zelandiae CBS 107.79]
MLETPNHTNRPELPAHVASFHDVQGHVDPKLQQVPYQDEGFEDFRDFVNFIDGVGLSAQWTPEYDMDWLRLDNYQESRRASKELERPRSPEKDEIAEDHVQLRTHSGDDVRESRARRGTYHVTEDHRKFLVSLLSGFPAPISEFEIPSRHAHTRYIIAFFSGFHSHFPFIHEPTYKPSCSPLELTLAMCAAGAQYCFERRSGDRLFRVAKAIVFERLRREESHFGPQTLAFIASTNVLSLAVPLTTRHAGPWQPVYMAKTLLILVGFATWERKDLLQQAFALRGLLVQCLRDNSLKEDETPSSIPSGARSALWDDWVQRESSRRTKLTAFCYINLHLRLPCCTPLWQASSATQWASLEREHKDTQMPFQQALSTLLQGTSEVNSVYPIPSPIGNYILLHALLQRIHVVWELSFPATSPATISGSELHIISRALRSWISLWQQAPESMLDPNNESGPILFTSSALLVVAYIQLSLDIGSYRHLESRDPALITEGLASLRDIEHNGNLLSALLYSTHALSIPVRLGIDRVARSQAFFWSVQQAMSSFEGAIFLGKWLCSLPSPLHDDSLSRSEHRIIHWIKRIIEEAYAVGDFDEERDLTAPRDVFRLGLAVLHIWCRFFRGNTQWQFVNNLGISLEKYTKTFT